MGAWGEEAFTKGYFPKGIFNKARFAVNNTEPHADFC